MAEVDYKSLFDKVKAFLQSKYQYSKLTLAEILSILLARIAICVVAFLCATVVLLYLSQALVNVLIASFNDVAMAYLAVAFFLFLLFYPVLSGQSILEGMARDGLRWLEGWQLIS